MNDDPGGPTRTDPGLRVDPVRIGRRSVAPFVVALVAIAFVGAAIAKPWQGPQAPAVTAHGSAPPPTAAAEPTGSPAPTAEPGVSIDLATAAVEHDAWGVGGLVVEDADGGPIMTIAEVWQPLPVPAPAADPDPTLGLEQGLGTPGRPLRAIEITTPRDALALDVRFWRLDAAEGQRRVLAEPVPGPDAGSSLWLPDPRDATAREGWPSADYQIDILSGRRVVHVVTHIDGDAPPVPRPAPSAPSSLPLLQALTTFPPGPFAFGPTTIEPVVVDSGAPLGTAKAWLASSIEPGGGHTVGRIVGDPIMGLGAVFEPGETIITAELERVSPARDMPAMRIVKIPGVDAYGMSTGPAVTLVPPDGLALADGLYHLIVAARAVDGTAYTSTWTLEILPAEPPIQSTQGLVQLRYFSAVLASGQQDVPAPIVSGADLGGSDGDGTCGGVARIRPTDEMVGLRTDPGDDVRNLRLVPIDTIRRLDVAIRFAADVDDGLTLIALPPGGIAPHQYALIATIGAGSIRSDRQYTVCVG